MEAPPTLAHDALTQLGAHARRPLAVVAMRGYLAPLGITLASLLEAVLLLMEDRREYARKRLEKESALLELE